MDIDLALAKDKSEGTGMGAKRMSIEDSKLWQELRLQTVYVSFRSDQEHERKTASRWASIGILERTPTQPAMFKVRARDSMSPEAKALADLLDESLIWFALDQ